MPCPVPRPLLFPRLPESSYARSYGAYGAWQWAGTLLPCIEWLRTYNVRRDLLWDCVAGLSVGCMVVPQGMSYANIAGLPSVYGLYGAFMPCLIYSLFGSSKQLAVGPVAVTSLLIGSSLKTLVPGADGIGNPNNLKPEEVDIQEAYNHKAIQLSFVVACMYTGVGLLRLGFVTSFLSHSVISGFTSGAAMIIGLSQARAPRRVEGRGGRTWVGMLAAVPPADFQQPPQKRSRQPTSAPCAPPRAL